MKKVIVVLSINLLLVAAQLGLAVGRSADGVTVSQANQKLETLKKENALLSEEIYDKSSLVYIASKSAEMGLSSNSVRFLGGANVAAARLSP